MSSIYDEEMIEEFECTGYWWLPNKPDDYIPGTLKFDPHKGGILKLMGLFEPMYEPELNKKIHKGTTVKCGIIQGVCEAKEITLKGCEGWYDGMSSPGYEKFKFSVDRIFTRKHFNKIKDINFKTVRVRFSYLDEWVNIFGGKINYPRRGRYNVSFRYISPKPIVLVDTNQYRISLVFGPKGPSHSFFQKDFNLRQETSISIEMKCETPYEKFVGIIARIQNFLTLAISKTVYPTKVVGLKDEWNETIKKAIPLDIEIFHSAQGKPETPEKVWPDEMLFTYDNIKESKASLNYWLEKAELLKPVYQSYFAVRYKPEMYAELQVLSLAHALEVYHSRTMNHPVFTKEQFKKRLKVIFDSIPLKYWRYKKWLEGELSWSNDLKLQQRLEELVRIKKQGDLFSEFLVDKKEFIKKVKYTRHFHTHYNKKLEKKAAKGKEFILLIRQMKLLLETYFLKEIGFSWKKIRTLIRKSSNYKACLYLIARQKPTQSEIVGVNL